MKVTLLNHALARGQEYEEDRFNDYEYLVKQAAAICVDRLDNPTTKGMETAINSGHYSILEHLPLTWLVEDVSRVLTHQLVRHRIASYSQQSQRYAKVDTIEDWYVTPDSIAYGHDNGTLFHCPDKYHSLMATIAEFYDEMCKAGIPNEDARYILPNACFTSILVSMNARSFVEASTLRTCNKAQWEIREMFIAMRESIKDIYPHVYELAFPNCYKGGCREVKMCKENSDELLHSGA